MKLMDFLIPDAIEPNLKSTNKIDVIKELVMMLKKTGAINDTESITRGVLEREELGTTAIGQGIAIPHGKFDAVENLMAAFGRSEKGIDFGSVDKQPVKLIFLLIAPSNSAGPHLTALARISRLLKNQNFRMELLKAKDKPEILRVCESEGQ
ncbi:PTS sugar transporter subunit IIA [Candidatus Poribacteria bacterium]|nr:PTS sugar transporter subunit IIA [Candidatus Poribacteria bacterium]